MGRGYEHHHVCLSGWLLILRVTFGGISLRGCWHAGREKKQVGGGGKGKKRERFSLMFFSRALVFHPVLYPPAEVCCGVTRQPPWCEPDRNVASFHRHLISLPITFPKLALRGCLGGERVIDPSQRTEPALSTALLSTQQPCHELQGTLDAFWEWIMTPSCSYFMFLTCR